MKALFINGSPRKNGNTAQLLKRAMDGAREAGAEVELVNLYDRSLNYKGCMSCFACKVKGGKKGVCSFKDDLQPILHKAVEADVLVCGSGVYLIPAGSVVLLTLIYDDEFAILHVFAVRLSVSILLCTFKRLNS